jgi:RNA polymerase-associated protein RTF1
MLEKKRALQAASGALTGQALTLARSKLNQERLLAQRRNDWDEVKQIDAELAELAGDRSKTEGAEDKDDPAARLTRINERNRAANLEAVRRAELADAERKRLRRRLESRTATPDPAKSTSNGTSPVKSEEVVQQPALASAAPRVDKFDESIVDEIEIDLGDF